MKLIELYKEWMETGAIPKRGLCWSLPEKYLIDLSLFRPNTEEENELWENGLTIVYWGSGLNTLSSSMYNLEHKFTDLRQTIVLLICAMNNEI